MLEKEKHQMEATEKIDLGPNGIQIIYTWRLFINFITTVTEVLTLLNTNPVLLHCRYFRRSIQTTVYYLMVYLRNTVS